MTRKDLQNVYNVNVVGPLLLAQALYDNVKASKGKQIVAISSGLGQISMNYSGFNHPAYKCSKAALNMAIKTLALESDSNKDQVIAVAVEPGFVQTDFSGNKDKATTSVDVSVKNMLTNVIDKKDLKSCTFYKTSGDVSPY